MTANARILIVFILSLLDWATANGQNVATTAAPVKREAYIETTDGRIIKGVFLRGDAISIEVETANGVQSLKIEKINHIRFVRVNLTYAAGTPGANTIVYKSPGSLFYHSSLSCPLAQSTVKSVPLIEAAKSGHTCTQCDPAAVKEVDAVHSYIPSQSSQSSGGGNREPIPTEEEEIAFLDSPPRTIVAVSNSDTYLIDFNGPLRWVTLHGISIDPLKRSEIANEFKTRLVKKSVYVRCADAGCSQVYLYMSKTGTSLNAELVKSGYARAAADSKYDVATFLRGTTPSTNTSSIYGSSNSTPGTDVHVRGYHRKDGTYVRPHTRSAPGTKSSGGSSRSGSRRR